MAIARCACGPLPVEPHHICRKRGAWLFAWWRFRCQGGKGQCDAQGGGGGAAPLDPVTPATPDETLALAAPSEVVGPGRLKKTHRPRAATADR